MNSTLALNPDTGKLAWHYQHIGADNAALRTAPEHGVVRGASSSMLWACSCRETSGRSWKIFDLLLNSWPSC